MLGWRSTASWTRDGDRTFEQARAATGGADTAEAGPTLFRLGRSVGLDAENRPEDVIAAKRALGWAGYYPADRARSPSQDATLEGDPQFLYGIRRFQADSGLSADSFMRRDGETATALNRSIAPHILAGAPATAGGAGTARLIPVGGPGWRQPDAWGNPAGWALEQAGEEIGGLLGVEEAPPEPADDASAAPSDAGAQQAAPAVVAGDGRTYPDLSTLPEERWRQVQLSTPEFKRGTQEVHTDGPIRISTYGGAAGLGVGGLFYHVTWFSLDERGEIQPNLTDGSPSLPHGGHIWTVAGPSYEYLYPPHPSDHGWAVRISIPPQPAVNGATIGSTLRVHTLTDEPG